MYRIKRGIASKALLPELVSSDTFADLVAMMQGY